MSTATRIAFAAALLGCDKATAEDWLRRLDAEGRDLESAINEMAARREAGLPFDPAEELRR